MAARMMVVQTITCPRWQPLLIITLRPRTNKLLLISPCNITIPLPDLNWIIRSVFACVKIAWWTIWDLLAATALACQPFADRPPREKRCGYLASIFDSRSWSWLVFIIARGLMLHIVALGLSHMPITAIMITNFYTQILQIVNITFINKQTFLVHSSHQNHQFPITS